MKEQRKLLQKNYHLTVKPEINESVVFSHHKQL